MHFLCCFHGKNYALFLSYMHKNDATSVFYAKTGWFFCIVSTHTYPRACRYGIALAGATASCPWASPSTPGNPGHILRLLMTLVTAVLQAGRKHVGESLYKRDYYTRNQYNRVFLANRITYGVYSRDDWLKEINCNKVLCTKRSCEQRPSLA